MNLAIRWSDAIFLYFDAFRKVVSALRYPVTDPSVSSFPCTLSLPPPPACCLPARILIVSWCPRHTILIAISKTWNGKGQNSDT